MEARKAVDQIRGSNPAATMCSYAWSHQSLGDSGSPNTPLTAFTKAPGGTPGRPPAGGKKYMGYIVPGREEPYVDFSAMGSFQGGMPIDHKLRLLKKAGEYNLEENKVMNKDRLETIILEEVKNYLH